MTDSNRQPARTGAVRRPWSLHRTVLSLSVAALLAAWLPFSVIYINALTTRVSVVAKPGFATQGNGASTGHSAHALAPVTTRTS